MRRIFTAAIYAIGAAACAEVLGVDGDGYRPREGSSGSVGSDASADASGGEGGAGGTGDIDASAGRAGRGGSAGRAGAGGSGGASTDASGGKGGAGGKGGIDASAGRAGAGGSAGAGAAGGPGDADATGGSAGSAGTTGAGGNAGIGGGAGASGSAGTAGSGGADAGSAGRGGAGGSAGASGSKDAGSDGGRTTSCTGLAPTCGPSGNVDCCASTVVVGGTFNRSNNPSFPATVGNFRFDRYEVTVGRFRNFVAAYSQTMIASGAGKNPNNPIDPGWNTTWNASLPADAAALASSVQCNSVFQTWTPSAGGNESRPINCIMWFVAQAFCIWDGGRLPTETEWNYAAAGGDEQREYAWGATAPGPNIVVYGCYGAGTCSNMSIAAVGSKGGGNGRWGQGDLAGNVWEWVQDWQGTYPPTCNNCANLASGSGRMIRGGSFYSDAMTLRTLDRSYNAAPTTRDFATGARCARAP